MRTSRLRVALATLALTAGGVVSGVAAAPAASANGPCRWITTDSAEVRENPSINSVVRKTVPAQYGVTGPAIPNCQPVTGTDGRMWVEVDCGCASDGLGFIIWTKVLPR